MELANQDTFRDANLYAAKRVDLVARLTACRSKEEAAAVITSAQELYSALFDAFQAGVDRAREIASNKCHVCGAPPRSVHRPGCTAI